MKSLFHPPSVLFGCDHVCVIDTTSEKDEMTTNAEVTVKPSIKMYIPLEMPHAHQPAVPSSVICKDTE